jgi:hypothetical protein
VCSVDPRRSEVLQVLLFVVLAHAIVTNAHLLPPGFLR